MVKVWSVEGAEARGAAVPATAIKSGKTNKGFKPPAKEDTAKVSLVTSRDLGVVRKCILLTVLHLSHVFTGQGLLDLFLTG